MYFSLISNSNQKEAKIARIKHNSQLNPAAANMHPKEVIKKAMLCEQMGYHMEALELYTEAVETLRQHIASVEHPEKQRFYQEHWERLDACVHQLRRQGRTGLQTIAAPERTVVRVQQIAIESGERGHSYQTLFGSYLNAEVREVHLYEPYLLRHFQLNNLVSFLELLSKNCTNLRYVRVVTKPAANGLQAQLDALRQICATMSDEGVALKVSFDKLLHDRKIMLSTGVTIKLGYGLHFFQPCASKYGLGLRELQFRKCLKTEIDIYRLDAAVSAESDATFI